MALVNILVFLVSKILHNPVFMQKSLFDYNYLSQIRKNVQGNIAFIFSVLSETVNGTV